MHLRLAEVPDIPAMHRVRVAVLENRLSDASLVTHGDYEDHLSSLGRGWVVEDGGVVVGFAIGCVTDGNIWALFVAPGSEQRGVGAALHDALTSSLFASGLHALWLTTSPGTRAEQFYLRRGWVPWPPHPGKEIRMSLSVP